MSEVQTTTTINSLPIGLTTIPWAGSTANIEGITLRDPLSGNGVSVVPPGTPPSYLLGVTGQYQNSSGIGAFCPVADNSAAISVGVVQTQQIIPAYSGKQIWICGCFVESDGTGTIQFVYGASNTPLSGVIPVTPETGFSEGSGAGAIMIAPAGNNVSIITTGSATAEGSVTWTYF